MELCKKAILTGLVMTFYSSFASALGLGEIKLNSALNQPLDAEIKLLHVRELAAREIVVDLGSPKDYERAGVDRIYFLSSLKFEVDLAAPGGPVVKVTSTEPVREPFLDFIVSAQWPSGRLLREYTLLIDLPIYTQERAEPVAAARKTPSTTPTTREPSARQQPSRAQQTTPRPTAPTTPTRSTPSTPAFDGSEYGPVGSNENLWGIANRVRPDNDVSVQQTMLAIQRLNPEAFINNNINLLRRGQVLRIPDKNEIVSMTTRDAINQVAMQNRAWQEGSTTAPAPQLEGSKRLAPTREESTTVEGRIKLSSMEDEDELGDGIGTGEGEEQGTQQIVSELASSQEELDAATREEAEIKSRIQAMEEQIATMEKLIEVSSDELRSLELAAAQTNEDADTAAVQVEAEADATAIDEDLTTEAAGENVDAADTEQETQQAPVQVEDAAPAEAQPAKPAITQAPAEQTPAWLKLIQDNLLYIAGGVGALIILIAALLFMRKRDDGFDDEFDDEFDQLGDDYQAFDDEALEDEPVDTEVDAVAAEVESEPEDEVQAEAETEDVVGECDIHIAYGQYDQAEDKLLRALESDPRNVAVRLKLLEVFQAQGDSEGFDSHFAKVRAIGDADTVARAERMRASFDGIAPFDESQYDVSAFLSKLNEDYESTDTQFEEPPVNENLSSSGFDYAEDDTLKFDFEDDKTVVPEQVEASAEDEVVLEGDSDLDIELDIDENISFDDVEIDDSEFAETSASKPVSMDDDLSDLDFAVADEESDEFKSSTAKLEGDDNQLSDDDFSDLDIALDDDFVSAESDETVKADFDSDFADDFSSTGDDLLEPETSFDDLDDEFLTAEDSASKADDLESELDFDLQKDLDDAIQEDATARNKALEQEDDFADLDLEGLDDSDLETDELSSSFGLDDSDAGDLPQKETSSSTLSTADEGKDFDVDYDLDDDIDLEELDKELGAFDLNEDSSSSVVSSADVETEPTDKSMEEPVTDFELEDQVDQKSAKESGSPISLVSDNKNVSTGSTQTDFEIPEFDPENDDDSNLEFLSDNDETATKLDLARAYIDMGDADGARDILDEIFEEGNDQQKKEAETLMSKLA